MGLVGAFDAGRVVEERKVEPGPQTRPCLVRRPHVGALAQIDLLELLGGNAGRRSSVEPAAPDRRPASLPDQRREGPGSAPRQREPKVIEDRRQDIEAVLDVSGFDQ